MSKSHNPPKNAIMLFKWFCGDAMVEDWMGDLEEIYFQNLDSKGPRKAKRLFWSQVISLVFSNALKKRKSDAKPHYSVSGPSMAMISNYFKVGYRNLAKHKLFTFINIIGLACGMSICLLALSMINSVQQFDKFHENVDRIYRLNTSLTSPEGSWHMATSAPLAADDLQNYPSLIEDVVRVNDGLRGNVRIGENEVYLGGLYAEPSFLEVFSFELANGDPTRALDAPFKMILTEKAAKRVFGHTDVIGELVQMGGKGDFIVSAIMKDYPVQSHVQFDVVASYATLLSHDRGLINRRKDRVFFSNAYHYLLLKDDVSTGDLEPVLAEISTELTTETDQIEMYLQPVDEIVSGENVDYGIGPTFDRLTMAFFVFVTFLILVPACFNYANLSMARALKRSKEIGLRKVVGGRRKDILFQFLTETIILTLIALVGSVFIFRVIRDEFLSMVNGADLLDLTISPMILVYFICFAIFTGLLAGFIPAAYFSKIKAIESLRGTVKMGSFGKINLRKGLTVAQFALSIFFIFGVISMSLQYRYTLNFEFGFNKENKMVIPLYEIDDNIFKAEFAKHSEVQSIGLASGLPGLYEYDNTYVYEEVGFDSIQVFQLFADNVFLSQLDFQMLAGEFFEEALNHDVEEQLIVNEKFVQTMNWDADQVLGKQVKLEESKYGRVVGVMTDFNHLPLRDGIQPFFFRYNPDKFRIATLNINSLDIFSTIPSFETSWANIEKNREFEFDFFEDKLGDVYDSFMYQIKIFGFLSMMAITISCLGMLGMVVFTSENRIKEIGIRKVMGADVKTITILLSSGFIKILAIGCFVGLPLAYLFFTQMFSLVLDEPKPLGIIEIVGSILVMMLLGGLSVVSQTVKTARLNPVDNLRYE